MGLTGHGTIVDVALIIALLIIAYLIIAYIIAPILGGGGPDVDMLASLKPILETTHTSPQLTS